MMNLNAQINTLTIIPVNHKILNQSKKMKLKNRLKILSPNNNNYRLHQHTIKAKEII